MGRLELLFAVGVVGCAASGDAAVLDTDVDTAAVVDTDPFGLADEHGPFVPCDDVPSFLGPDDATRLGVSAAELLAALTHSGRAVGWWSGRGPAVGVTVRLDTPREILFHARARRDGEPDPDEACVDQLTLTATLAVTTGDGGLALSVPALVVATTPDDAVLDANLAADALGAGSWQVAAVLDPLAWDDVFVGVSGSWAGGIHQGWLQVGARSVDDGIELTPLSWTSSAGLP